MLIEPKKQTKNTESTKKHKNKILLLFSVFFCFFVFTNAAYAIEPLDTFYTQQRYLSQIQANRAWNEVRETPDIVIAVLDTGVGIDHPDLRNNIWVNEDEIPGNGKDDDGNGFVDDVNGWDFINGVPDPRPKFETGYTSIAMHHGTLVAGIIAGEGGNDIGVSGVTWKAKIMPLRVLDAAGTGTTKAVSEAINYARENGAQIINLSFVGDEPSVTLDLALERAHKAGIMIVAAAGNELTSGVDMDVDPRYPVCQDGPDDENWIIGVTAVDSNDYKASFSNYGSSCVDITAPGVRIFSTQFMSNQEPGFENGYGQYTGTSLASPQVAGVAALIKTLNPNISLSEWQRLITENTTNIDPLNASFENKLGAGRLNAFLAVDTSRRFALQNEEVFNIIASAGPGGGPHVRLFSLNQSIGTQFFANDASYDHGVRAVRADVINDEAQEFITVPYGVAVPEVKIFNSYARLERSFIAYDEHFRFGMDVVVDDIDNDGYKEIITSPLAPGGPHIRIFTPEGKLKSEFFAFNPNHRGGAHIAVADVDGDKEKELIVTSADESLPIVRVFNQHGFKEYEFYAFEPDQLTGMSVAAYNNMIVVGTGAGGSPTVRVFDSSGNLKKEWLAYQPSFHGGVNVAIADINHDNLPEVVTGPGVGGGPHLRIFDTNGKLITQWMAFNPAFRGGISVSASN